MKHTRSIISITMATIVLLSLCAVCASTGVGAAQGSRASVQATPSLVGSPIAAGTGPSACVLNGSTGMYVFVKGYDGALWYRIWNTTTYTWTGGWVSLGGQLTSSPAAVSRQAGYLSVYVRGTNGAVYEKAYFSGAWHDWANLGGQIAPGTGPGTSGWSGREDVFVQGTNGNLYQKTYTFDSGWSGWVNLGGQLTSSPAAASWYAGSIDIWVRGTNGAVYDTSYYHGAWYDWVNLGGQIAPGTGPAACSWNESREDVFVEGTNGALYQLSSTSGWWSWVNLGGKLSASPTAATFTFQSAIFMPVFVRGTNGLIYENAYYYDSWYGWSGPYQGPP